MKRGYDVLDLGSGMYAVVGETDSYGDDQDVYLVLVRDSDTFTTGMPIQHAGYDFGRSFKLIPDGKFVIAGFTSDDGNNWDVFLIKTNSIFGDTLWTRRYGGGLSDMGYSVDLTDDGGFIIAGNTMSFGAGDYDVYLIKTDSMGNVLWTKTYGGGGGEEGWDVEQTSDGGYIVVGRISSFGGTDNDIYLIKTDTNGDTLWTKTYGGSGQDYGRAVLQTEDGGYLVVGYTSSFGAGGFDVYVVKTDDIGNVVWTETIGGSGDDEGISVDRTPDGGYIIAGISEGDVYVVKITSSGIEERTYKFRLSGIDLLKCSNAFNSENIEIDYSVPENGYVNISLYNNSGRRIRTLIDRKMTSGRHRVILQRDGLKNGVYFIRYNIGNKTGVKKLMLLK